VAVYSRNYSDEISFPFRTTQNGNVLASTVAKRVFTGSRSGQNVPGWRALIKKGSNATSPYTSDRYTILSRNPGSAALSGFVPQSPGLPPVNLTQTFEGYIVPLGAFGHLSGNTSAAEAVALSQLYRKIDSELSRLNSPAVLAEFGDVLRQFGSPFRSLVNLTNRRINLLAKARKGLNGTKRQVTERFDKIVADTYLEYAFGLAPLISDTRSIAEAFARFNYEKTGEQPRRSKVVGRGETVTTANAVDLAVVPNTCFVYKTTTLRRTEFRCQYICGLSSSHVAAFGSNERLLQLLGFQPLNWIPAAWEVVPWSFLIDYFSNVGDILQASVTNTSGVTWISKSVVTKTTYQSSSPVDSALTTAQIKALGYKGGGGGSCGSYKGIRTTFVRTAPAKLTIPNLTFTVPTETVKLLNMAALLVSRR
jgi:hypothetical protein